MENINNIAVITGGASGLGFATAKYIIKNGGKVAIFDINNKIKNSINIDLGENAIFIQVDITKDEQVADGIKKVIDIFGFINVLVNCAGIVSPLKVIGKKGVMEISHWSKVIDINLIGYMRVISLVVEQMIKNKINHKGERGVIINTASIAAFDGQMGQSAYSASKAGVVGMTLPLAREFSNVCIRVMTVAPGLFLTPMLLSLPDEIQESLGKMVPFPNRLGEPDEFAALVGHIIENPMLNGETIRLDGALRLPPR